jgi:hypothetical protein
MMGLGTKLLPKLKFKQIICNELRLEILTVHVPVHGKMAKDRMAKSTFVG